MEMRKVDISVDGRQVIGSGGGRTVTDELYSYFGGSMGFVGLVRRVTATVVLLRLALNSHHYSQSIKFFKGLSRNHGCKHGCQAF
jgi:hypothetical protein